MWKKTDLSQASYRQIEFEFVEIEDGFRKTMAKFEYPYTNGGDLEDMGLEPREVRLKAIFLEDTYDKLGAFMAALEERGPGEVVHPVFGTFKAVPMIVSMRHDERAYYAEVDITFIEHKDLSVVTPVLGAGVKLNLGSEQTAETIDEADAALRDELKDAGVPEGIPAAGLGEGGYMATISGYMSKVRDVVRKVDSVVSTVKGYINAATSPFKLITSVVTFATNLPGTVLGSFAEGIESVAGAYSSLINAPGKFVDSLEIGLSKIEKALGDFEGDDSLKASWHVCKSSALFAAATLELAVDEAAENGTTMNLKSYGVSAEASRTTVMTIDEIDEVAAVAREALNAAISTVREVYGDAGYELELTLKRQALTIQEMADAVRLKREKIVEYEVPSSAPLHVIAFNLYGDAEEAERLLRINKIRNPNFIRAGEVIRVYA